MAAFLVRMYIRHSFLRNGIMQNQIKKSMLHNLFVTYIQCSYYHTTAINCNPEKIKTQQTKISKYMRLPKNSPIITVWKDMTVQDLANSAQRDLEDVMDALFFTDKNKKYKPNTIIDSMKIISSTVKLLGAKSKMIQNSSSLKEKVEIEHDVFKRPLPDKSLLIKRFPIVTVMGHVDHGKTTLLDTLRNTSVVETEFGGITQHIGAFRVTMERGETVTFLDTPGHAAFSSMRERGAQVTDIVILVVAADDGVMEQTLQSIDMANAANVPIIVAINKIDKPNSNIAKTQQLLAQAGVVVEQVGGDVQCIHISALKGTNLNNLVEAIAVQAELMELKGDPTGLVEAVAIECLVSPGRGKLVTALIQRGTLRRGNVLVSGTTWAKVKAMFDYAGKPIVEANLSDPVQIIGWRDLPIVGDEILEVKDEKSAHLVIKFRQNKILKQKAEEHQKIANEKLQKHMAEHSIKLAERRQQGLIRYKRNTIPRKKQIVEDNEPTVNVIIKADVAGTAEAILNILDTYQDNQCCLNIIDCDMGAVNETDIDLADTFEAIIYRFNVSLSNSLRDVAKHKNVSIRSHNIIYKLVDDIKNEINSSIKPVDVEEIIGEATVLQEFQITDNKKKVNVAGCKCVSGSLEKSAMYRLERSGNILYTGKIISMRHLKNEINSINKDMECGIMLEDSKISFMPEDTLICFKVTKRKPETNWNPGF